MSDPAIKVPKPRPRFKQATRKIVRDDVTITVILRGAVRPGVTDADAKETISTGAAFFANFYASEWDKIARVVAEEVSRA